MNRLYIVILFLSFSFQLFSQNIEYPKDFISIEIFGKGTQYINVTFERVICCNVSVGGGIGFNNYTNNISSIVIANEIVNGKVKELDLFIPLYSHLQFGNEKHKFLINYGVNMQTEFLNEIYLQEDKSFHINIIPFTGIGYEYLRPKIKYRVQAYINFLQSEGILPDFSPWAGVSIAVPIKF